MAVNVSGKLLALWEQCANEPAERRNQALLALAEPGLSKSSLSGITLGERNQRLLALRKRLFGAELAAYVECSGCGEALDLAFSTDDFLATAAPAAQNTYTVDAGDLLAQVRLPDGNDLAMLESVASVKEGRKLLFENCVLSLQRGKQSVDLSALDPQELDQLESGIEALDARMELLFDLHCPACSHHWQTALDIGAYLWSELETLVKKTLEDIHLLASSYGWSEADILAMPDIRRQHYIGRLLQ